MLDSAYKGPLASFVNPLHLARYGNRARQGEHPKDPTTLDFEYDHQFIGNDFMKFDIRRKAERNFVFATSNGLSILSKAKTW
jgi:hypothetical protein